MPEKLTVPVSFQGGGGRLLRLLIAAAAALMTLWGLLPLLISGIFNTGVIAMCLAGLLILACCLFYTAFRRLLSFMWARKPLRVISMIVLCLIGALLLLFIVVSCFMLHAAAKEPPKNATVIVLGAALRDDRPSIMLADRLDAAEKYLRANPESVCIVSGGQGDDELYPEALVMKNYLVKRGIEESRIYMEDASSSTAENIRYSKQIIEEHNLNRSIVIATQEFHQLRAQSFAKKGGLTDVGPCTCRSPWYLLGCYWVRDFAGLCHMALLGD